MCSVIRLGATKRSGPHSLETGSNPDVQDTSQGNIRRYSLKQFPFGDDAGAISASDPIGNISLNNVILWLLFALIKVISRRLPHGAAYLHDG